MSACGMNVPHLCWVQMRDGAHAIYLFFVAIKTSASLVKNLCEDKMSVLKRRHFFLAQIIAVQMWLYTVALWVWGTVINFRCWEVLEVVSYATCVMEVCKKTLCALWLFIVEVCVKLVTVRAPRFFSFTIPSNGAGRKSKRFFDEMHVILGVSPHICIWSDWQWSLRPLEVHHEVGSDSKLYAAPWCNKWSGHLDSNCDLRCRSLGLTGWLCV